MIVVSAPKRMRLLPSSAWFAFFAILLLLGFFGAFYFFVHSGIREKEANEELFKDAAILEGDPVTSICLEERGEIDDSFLVAIKNRYRKIQKLDLSHVHISDYGLKNVASLHELRELSLFGVGIFDGTRIIGISNQGLENIKTLEKVEALAIAYSSITGKGLEHLKNWVKMKDLYIAQCPISNDDLEVIGKFPSLTKLGLVKTAVTSAGLVRLGKMTNLTKLRIPDIATDQSLRSLSELSNLEELWLDDGLVTDEGLSHLARLEKLRILHLAQTKVNGIGLKDQPFQHWPVFHNIMPGNGLLTVFMQGVRDDPSTKTPATSETHAFG